MSAESVECRERPHRVGERAWIAYPQASYARPGWPDGMEVSVTATTKDTVAVGADSREETMPHYLVSSGMDYRASRDWLPEWHPLVQKWMRERLAHYEAEPGSHNYSMGEKLSQKDEKLGTPELRETGERLNEIEDGHRRLQRERQNKRTAITELAARHNLDINPAKVRDPEKVVSHLSRAAELEEEIREMEAAENGDVNL